MNTKQGKNMANAKLIHCWWRNIGNFWKIPVLKTPYLKHDLYQINYHRLGDITFIFYNCKDFSTLV